ncbi:MAG: hypothetical protein GDYSWBUE_000786 [Candidatus Fervidibacterota bacterium]
MDEVNNGELIAFDEVGLIEHAVGHEEGHAETERKRIIHPTAIVSPKAEIGEGVVIGPYAIIEDDVFIGDGTIIEAYVVVKRWTYIGKNNHIYPGTVLGGEPQDVKFSGERSHLIIGDNNVIREHVTIHRSTGEDNATRIGNNCMIMAYCHIGHNCVVGDYVNIASYTGISGHAVIEDHAMLGGMVGVHQYTTIGRLAMIGGMSKVVQDIPPFMLADGRPAQVKGINKVGLARDGVPPDVRMDLHRAYKLLYRSSLNTTQAIEVIMRELKPSHELIYLLEFIKRIGEGRAGRQRDKRKAL